MRKPFNTSIEEDIQKAFRKSCDNSVPKLPMNTVLEMLMDGYNKGKIKIITDVQRIDD